jgi:hypothetical protein
MITIICDNQCYDKILALFSLVLSKKTRIFAKISLKS